MNKRKHYEQPSGIVIELSFKDGLMYMSEEQAGVREYRGYYDDYDEEKENEAPLSLLPCVCRVCTQTPSIRNSFVIHKKHQPLGYQGMIERKSRRGKPCGFFRWR